MKSNLPRLIVVGPSPPPLHGVAVFTRMVVDGLQRRGLAVHFLDTGDRRADGRFGRLDFANLKAGIRATFQLLMHHPGGSGTIVYLPLSQNRLAVLRDLTLCAVAWFRRSDTIMHLHGSQFGELYRRSGRILRAACRLAFRRVRFVIVLGESLRSVFQDLVPAARVVVIPNGVPDPRPDGPVKPRVIDGLSPIFLFLGTVSPRKGILDLIEAVRILRASGHPVRVRVGGDFNSPATADLCRARVASVGLTLDIEFLGPLVDADKLRLLESARALVCPSRDPEGMPLVILEAMAMSVPVVATPQGAVPEVIRHEVSGLLVPPCSPPDLAAAMRRLSENADEAWRWGASGRELFEQSFTSERVLDDLLRVFASASAPAAP